MNPAQTKVARETLLENYNAKNPFEKANLFVSLDELIK